MCPRQILCPTFIYMYFIAFCAAVTTFKGKLFILSGVWKIWGLCVMLGSCTVHDCCDVEQDNQLLGVCDHQWSAWTCISAFKKSEWAAGQLDSGALQGRKVIWQTQRGVAHQRSAQQWQDWWSLKNDIWHIQIEPCELFLPLLQLIMMPFWKGFSSCRNLLVHLGELHHEAAGI